MPPAESGGSRSLTEGGVSRNNQWIHQSVASEWWLWFVVVAALALDTWLTFLGLRLGLAEGNPVLAAGIDLMGFAAVGLAKAAAVGLGVVCRLLWPTHALMVPLGLALPWLLAAGLNTARILLAL